ncbi:MAG: hypothetical protein ACLP3B_18985, partial [Syntrophobacteraceae bacterium]
LSLGYPMQPFQGKKLKIPHRGRVHSRQMLPFLVCRYAFAGRPRFWRLVSHGPGDVLTLWISKLATQQLPFYV